MESATKEPLLQKGYLHEGETTWEDIADRVSTECSKRYESSLMNLDLKEVIYKYMVNGWFTPSTPILSNAGKKQDDVFMISCFLNEMPDTKLGILDTIYESCALGYGGGGVGINLGNVRASGEKISSGGETPGIIPITTVFNATTNLVKQGGTNRKGSVSLSLDVSHPEIKEFIKIRTLTGGDERRKALDVHHSVSITDDFMNCVEQEMLAIASGEEKKTTWNLISPHTKEVIETISALDLWADILKTRLETGEPYIFFRDNVNKQKCQQYEMLGWDINMSNLCHEICLHTSTEKTAVCCLASINLEKYDEWKDEPFFIMNILQMLSNVMNQTRIKMTNHDKARGTNTYKRIIKSIEEENSVGLGTLGFHALLQKRMLPFGSKEAKALNKEIFEKIQKDADYASAALARILKAIPKANEYLNLQEHFVNKIAIAPNESTAKLLETSPSIEPFIAPASIYKSTSGSIFARNKYIIELLKEKGKDTPEVWNSIVEKHSVQHLDFLSDHEKEVFKSAFEIDQKELIEQAAIRQPYIDQAQSLNLFFYPDVSDEYLEQIHRLAWKKGIKTLYYCRSKSKNESNIINTKPVDKNKVICDDEVCLACQ